MLEALLKLFVSLTTASVIALHSVSPFPLTQQSTHQSVPSVSSVFDKESTELLIEETFILLYCRFIVNFYQSSRVSEMIEILKATDCLDYFEIHKSVRLIPLIGSNPKRQKGERDD
ncbi:MAG: hypothetical protein QXT86_14250 [Archaeoglobaceae archaeon]